MDLRPRARKTVDTEPLTVTFFREISRLIKLNAGKLFALHSHGSNRSKSHTIAFLWHISCFRSTRMKFWRKSNQSILSIKLIFLSSILLMGLRAEAATCLTLLKFEAGFKLVFETHGWDYGLEYRKWNTLIKELLESQEIPNLDLPKILKVSDGILGFALENAMQHGSQYSNEQYPRYDRGPKRIIVTLSGQRDESDIYLSVSNPQMKPFPEALQKEVFAPSILGIHIPDEQRCGYQCNGWAHNIMIGYLHDLPKGSSLKWAADGTNVTFTLKIHIQ